MQFQAGFAPSGDELSAGARAVARGLRRPSLAPGQVGAVAALLDVVALALGLWFAAYASDDDLPPFDAALRSGLAAIALVALVWVLGGYRLPSLRRFWRWSGLLAGLGMVSAGILHGALPASLLLPVFVLPARGLGAAMAAAALDFGLTERRAVIIGGGTRAAQVMAALARRPTTTSVSAVSSTIVTTAARRRCWSGCRSSARSSH
jgi:hypothetical protein